MVTRRFLTDLLSLPTAPFAEHFVIAYIERFCERRPSVKLTRDSVGNLLIRVRKGKRRIARPVCITAHLDHPGFVADKMTAKGRVRAFWRGGVPKEYFVGTGVRFFVDQQWVRGKVRSIKTIKSDGQQRVDTASIEVPREIAAGSIGMWDLPEPKIKGNRIFAGACDDLAGAAAMLSAIDELVRGRKSCDAYFLFTRAEEVGFIGAIAATRLGTVPDRCYIVAMETSSELPSAKMGDGPILRVGDRATTFTSPATAHCHRIARELDASSRTFHYQRKLMDGGTCESSAYCTLGYEATGMCIALGNYHNVDLKRKKIGPEYVDLRDYSNVVTWFVELARAPHAYTGKDQPLVARLKELEGKYRPLLRSTRLRAR